MRTDAAEGRLDGVFFVAGSSGIGAATARLAARRGARLRASRMEEKRRALADEIAREGGVCGFRAADLTAVAEAVKACYDQ